MADIFHLSQHKTSVLTEIRAGIVTFMTMAYIVIVNPQILKSAGIPWELSVVATILVSVFGTLLMAFYANRPFAIAPYMGENAFLAFTVIGLLQFKWQDAIGMVFLGGVLFTLLTISGLRAWFTQAIPASLKYSMAVGIGLFLTFIGLKSSGIIVAGTPDVPVKIGYITDAKVLLAIFALLLICALVILKVKGALLIGIIITSIVAYIAGLQKPPDRVVSMPPNIIPHLVALNLPEAILRVLTWGTLHIILALFLMDFLDTMATLIGCSARAGFLDENGNLPQIERPMLADALSTMFGACLGTTTSGTFIESAAGIEEGGRTGLTALVVAILFLLCLFFSPLIAAIPPQATGAALIIVGILMFFPITRINFQDYTEFIPAFVVIIMMTFSFNIGIGLTAGFVIYPLFKIISGRIKEVHPAMWGLFILCLLFFIFYPYAK